MGIFLKKEVNIQLLHVKSILSIRHDAEFDDAIVSSGGNP